MMTHNKSGLRSLAAGTALALVLPLMAGAEQNPGSTVAGCALLPGGVLPAGCVQPAAGTVVVVPKPASAADHAVGNLGDLGFAIEIEAPRPGPVRGKAASGSAFDVDRMLTEAGVQVSYEGLGAETRLAVSTADLRRSFRAGETVTFRASSNYPAWIKRAEVRVLDRATGKLVAAVPVAANGSVGWAMPATGASEMDYVLRVYDSAGRFDETHSLPLNRTTAKAGAPELDGPVIAAAEGDDMTRRRAIPVAGGAVTVTAENLAPSTTVRVMGEPVIVTPEGKFVMQRILPPGAHEVQVAAGRTNLRRSVDIPAQDWFATGLADLTVTKSQTLGRLAGYAKGTLADGTLITGSLDTREGPVESLLRDLGRKNPDAVLRGIRPQDVYPTFGDDSTSYEDAPTSGKVYLRVQKGNSHVMWGDFKATEDSRRLVRTDRTLYGAQGVWESPSVTRDGEARLRFSAYAASPDRLGARDVLRGTGASTYFLGRQDIMSGTETLLVQVRDKVSGAVLSSRRLVPGTDYEFNAFQGVVQLARPLESSASTGGLIDQSRNEVVLVAQYDYVPTGGIVSGMAMGARGEAWLTDSLRFGVSAQRDTTGLADTTVMGADALWQITPHSSISADYAVSEGPGLGTSASLNGGLDLITGASAGALGTRAEALRFEAKGDLAELSGGALTGKLAAYYDRKDKGFVSADFNVAQDQEQWGLSGEVGVARGVALTFGHDDFSDATGKSRVDSRIGAKAALSQAVTLEAELARTERAEPGAAADRQGSRTDLGAKLTWAPDDDRSAYVFGTTTLARDGGLPANDRLGLGGKLRLSEKWVASAEVSDGTLGAGAKAELRYDNNAGTQYWLGYRLDPNRRLENTGVIGADEGTFVMGADSKVNETLRYTAENTYDLFGNRKSLTTAYGVTYTPSDVWTYSGKLTYGESELPGSGTLVRRGLSVAVDYSADEKAKGGARAEVIEDTSSTDATKNRLTLGFSGYARYELSDDWRFLGNLDALISKSRTDSLRDGKYIEATLGFAYRPAINDRVNLLARATYLYDLPGADQVSVDGTKNGPQQKSLIFSIDGTYDLDQKWTVGGKYGYRLGQSAPRGSTAFTPNSAHLAVFRVDYHLVHNWDAMAELRAMRFVEPGVTETGAVAGMWRHMGNNLRVGVGYQWGRVSDDLRQLNGKDSGLFLNVTGKF